MTTSRASTVSIFPRTAARSSRWSRIAQSQFGGQIAVAVRSPSVRQLVMLYSEASGQKMPLSATTPYAGSLVEQGGKLYQQASYQDGQAHAYALEHSDARRYRDRNLFHSRWPEHGWRAAARRTFR